ncbi:uncharacterized protein SAPINGB_P001630 [Magnusiomyces paraingens]|uniref:Ketoreductase (KR) domain-containing protein n=1 Tax=Magnusiomyces paraingens TaxID=2606893 RepID=A0A5E8B8V5_9ASCO|nr:uncharacterized protein SAPINGB_P001630 [Saprochaete ingens]VVT47275.1 unnamed protein product [Saprochaete ingens]
MPKYDVITRSLKAYAKSPAIKAPVGVFVGGTSGIGLNTALAFARATAASEESPKIYIVGRDPIKASAAEIEIKKLNPKAVFNFLQHDLLYIEQAKRVSNIINNHETKVNLLFLSQGCFPAGGRQETSEGIDSKLATAYYTRWSIINDILPLLNGAADAGESARVVSVLGAGYEATDIDATDFDLKNSYSLLRVLKVGPAYNTIAAARFAFKYPKVSFIHTSPGSVYTNVYRDVPWYARYIMTAISRLISTTPEVSGEYHLYAGLTGEQFGPGEAHILNNNMEEAYSEAEKNSNAGLFSKDLEKQLWDHTEEVFSKAVELDATK